MADLAQAAAGAGVNDTLPGFSEKTVRDLVRRDIVPKYVKRVCYRSKINMFSLFRTVNQVCSNDFALWLCTVDPDLVEHSMILVHFGLRTLGDIDTTCDSDAIREIIGQFKAAGARQVQLMRLSTALSDRVKKYKQTKREGALNFNVVPSFSSSSSSASAASLVRMQIPSHAPAPAPTSKRGRAERGEQDADFQDSDPNSDSEDEDGQSGRGGAGLPGKLVTMRTAVRKGTAFVAAGVVAEREGRKRIPSFFPRKTDENRRGVGSRASAVSAEAGRARSFSKLSVRSHERTCVVFCKSAMDVQACICSADADLRCIGDWQCATM